MSVRGLDCDRCAKEPPESRVHSKSFVANTLNAVAVMEDPPPKEMHLTILTCVRMETPSEVLVACDRFDGRSVIENSGNKEAKQAWKLEAPLEKGEAALFLTFLCSSS
jgi:hypothetical protein